MKWRWEWETLVPLASFYSRCQPATAHFTWLVCWEVDCQTDVSAQSVLVCILFFTLWFHGTATCHSTNILTIQRQLCLFILFIFLKHNKIQHKLIQYNPAEVTYLVCATGQEGESKFCEQTEWKQLSSTCAWRKLSLFVNFKGSAFPLKI